MERVLNSNIGQLICGRLALLPAAQTAGAAASASGVTIDRFSLVAPPNSSLFIVPFTATLGSGHTLSIALDVQNAPDGTTWTDYATQASTLVATGPSGGGVVTGQLTFAVNLTSAQEFLRLAVLPAFSATGTDTCVVFGAVAFGGQDTVPSSV